MSGAGCPARKVFFLFVANCGEPRMSEGQGCSSCLGRSDFVPKIMITHTTRQEWTQEQHHESMAMCNYTFSKLQKLSVNWYLLVGIRAATTYFRHNTFLFFK